MRLLLAEIRGVITTRNLIVARVDILASGASHQRHGLVHLVLHFCDLAPDLLVLSHQHIDLLLGQSSPVHLLINEDIGRVIVPVKVSPAAAIVVASVRVANAPVMQLLVVVVERIVVTSDLDCGIGSHNDDITVLLTVDGHLLAVMKSLTRLAVTALVLLQVLPRAATLSRSSVLITVTSGMVLTRTDVIFLPLSASTRRAPRYSIIFIARCDRQLVVDGLVAVVYWYVLSLLDLGDLVANHFIFRRHSDLVHLL